MFVELLDALIAEIVEVATRKTDATPVGYDLAVVIRGCARVRTYGYGLSVGAASRQSQEHTARTRAG